MRKKKWILPIIALLSVWTVFFAVCSRLTNMNFITDGEAVYMTDKEYNCIPLSEQDLADVVKLLDGRFLYHDTPSCGFSAEVSIRFNNGTETFCIARDMCPILYWKNREMYIKLTEQNAQTLRKILRGYGMQFPCI